jgi:hypothetical protein
MRPSPSWLFRVFVHDAVSSRTYWVGMAPCDRLAGATGHGGFETPAARISIHGKGARGELGLSLIPPSTVRSSVAGGRECGQVRWGRVQCYQGLLQGTAATWQGLGIGRDCVGGISCVVRMTCDHQVHPAAG